MFLTIVENNQRVEKLNFHEFEKLKSEGFDIRHTFADTLINDAIIANFCIKFLNTGKMCSLSPQKHAFRS